MKKQTLKELAREERNKYAREWRKKNQDKIKQHQNAYWQRRAEKKLREQGGLVNETTDEHHQRNG